MIALHEDRCYCVSVLSVYCRAEMKRAGKAEMKSSLLSSGNTDVLWEVSHSPHPPF